MAPNGEAEAEGEFKVIGDGLRGAGRGRFGTCGMGPPSAESAASPPIIGVSRHR